MRFGTKPPDNGATWSIGECSKCGEKNQYVCAERDFGVYEEEKESNTFIDFLNNLIKK